MPLTVQQSARLYEVIQHRFPGDSPEALGLRILRLAINNNPSPEQRALILTLLSQEVGALDAVLATYDETVAATKTELQGQRDAINALAGSL